MRFGANPTGCRGGCWVELRPALTDDPIDQCVDDSLWPRQILNVLWPTGSASILALTSASTGPGGMKDQHGTGQENQAWAPRIIWRALVPDWASINAWRIEGSDRFGQFQQAWPNGIPGHQWVRSARKPVALCGVRKRCLRGQCQEHKPAHQVLEHACAGCRHHRPQKWDSVVPVRASRPRFLLG